MSYAPFSSMVAPARHRPALWRLILGIITVFAFTMVWVLVVFPVARALIGLDDIGQIFVLISGEAASPYGVILMLTVISGMGLGTFIAARLWHKRSVGSLFGGGARTLHDFVVAGAVTLVLMILIQLAFLPFDDLPTQSMSLGRWLAWMPYALLAILAQTGAEEIMIRGYIQTQLAARFRKTAVWLVVPSVLFAALHYAPGMSTGLTLYILIGTFVFGLMAADLTARTGSIGAAWGFHFANNILAILIISYDSSFAGLNLFNAASPLDTITGFSPVFVLDFLAIVLVWLTIRRVLAT